MAVDPNYLVLKKRNRFTRWLVRVLVKLEVLEHKKEYAFRTDVERVEIDLGDLFNSIRRELDYFMSRNIVIERILVGRSQYEQFLRSGDLRENNLQIPYTDLNRMIFGARVELNPFIDGIVFIPKEKW